MAKAKITDRLRGFIDPEFPLKKARSSYLAHLIEQEKVRSQFKASETNRLNSYWQTSNESINTTLARELRKMRNRSRWCLLNIPNAQSAVNAIVNYCIGTGIRPESTVHDIKVENLDGQRLPVAVENEIWNEEVDSLWDQWSTDVDITASPNSPEAFYDIQRLILRKVIEDGEAFVHQVVDLNNPTVPIYLEMFEPDCLDQMQTKEPSNGNPIVMGIELDKITYRPVAYHVCRNSIGTGVNETYRYDAKDIYHIFIKQRPGQVRGYPWMHAVIDKFFQLNEYEDTELLSCKIAACFSVFITNPKGVTPGGDFLPGEGSSGATDANGQTLSHIQPAMIGNIPHGSDVSFAQPQKPGAMFGMFTEHIQRQCGAGIDGGLSYESITRDTSKTSYASGRLSQQMDFQSFRTIISFMNNKFNKPFRNNWLKVAILKGVVKAPGYGLIAPKNGHGSSYWSSHHWIPSGWQFGVNPAQEIAAQRDSMRAGISTLADECAFVGRDWRQQLRMNAKIKKEADRLGLNLTSDGTNSIINGTQNESSAEQEEIYTDEATTGKKEKAKA